MNVIESTAICSYFLRIISDQGANPSENLNRYLVQLERSIQALPPIIGIPHVGIADIFAVIAETGATEPKAERKISFGSVLKFTMTDHKAGTVPNVSDLHHDESTLQVVGVRHGVVIDYSVDRLFRDADEIRSRVNPAGTAVGTRHLVAALLISWRDEKLRTDLEKANFHPRATLTALQNYLALDTEDDIDDQWKLLIREINLLIRDPLGSQSIGSRIHAVREANDDELCLDIDYLAQAVTQTLHSARDDFGYVLAIFGEWGRGKTTLMKRVAKMISEKFNYSVVNFSAWKYPKRPDVWIHLYQAIKSNAHNNSIKQRLRLAYHVSTREQGWLAAVFGLALIAVSQIAAILAPTIFNYLGIAGALIIILFLASSFIGGSQIFQALFWNAEHFHRLGLQATIGEDLRSLLCSWVSVTENNHRWLKTTAIALLTWLALGLYGYRVGQEIQNGAATPIYVFFLAISLVLLLLLIYASRPLTSVAKVLVVVDDLDRCEPEQMLEVIESMRIYLENEHVGSRMQIALLLDRQIFRAALLSRAKRQSILPAKNPAYLDSFLRAQEEKYFGASISMIDIGKEGVTQLISAIVDREFRVKLKNEEEIIRSQANAPPPTKQVDKIVSHPPKVVLDRVTKETYFGEAEEQLISQTVPDDGERRRNWELERINAQQKLKAISEQLVALTPNKPLSDSLWNTDAADALFSDYEREKIKEIIGQIDAVGITPRRVRCLLIRYQIARHLLRLNGAHYEVRELLEALIARAGHGDPVTDKFSNQVQQVISVVA